MAAVKRRLFFSTCDLSDILFSLLGLVAFITFIPVFTYFYFAQDLQSKDSIMNRNNTGVVLLDRNNKPFFTFFQANYKQVIPLSHIPNQTQEAVVAAEDGNFYSEPGFSVKSIVRAAYEDVTHHKLTEGGSTITQQLVKNSLLTSQKNFLRKYQELVLASEIERRYSKQEILEMYLNSVYFGKGAFGIEEAAQAYFGEDANQLTVTQSTYLAGLLPSPSYLSQDLPAAKMRQTYVLSQMVKAGEISGQQANQAQHTDLSFASGENEFNTIAPHFALMVRDWLVKKYGEEQVARSGFQIHTTIDLTFQKVAEQAVRNQVAAIASQNVSNGAAVAIDPKTGEVLALVGSVDWNNDQFGKVNMAITPRQPGSSFKPIVYGYALENHQITAATILQDVSTMFPGGYKPLDYDRRFRGPVTVRRALDNSLNIPAVEVMQKVGVPAVLSAAANDGITTLGNDPSQYGLSLVLGAGEVKLIELTNFYAALANAGEQHPITLVSQIDDKQGHVVYQYKPEEKQIISPETAYILSSILSDAKTRAEEFGTLLNISRIAAVKTGTTEDYKDALTLGYTPSITVGVWVGNNNNTPMSVVAGSLGAAPIWKDMMEWYLRTTPVEQFIKPDDIVEKEICSYGSVGTKAATSSARIEYFLPGTEPSNFCSSQPPHLITTSPTLSAPVLPTIVSPQPPTVNQSVPSLDDQEKSKNIPPGQKKRQ